MTSGKAQDEYEYQLRQQNLDKVRSLRDQLEAAEQRIAVLTAERDGQDAANASLVSQVHDAEQRIAELERSLQQAIGRNGLADYEQRIAELEQDIADCTNCKDDCFERSRKIVEENERLRAVYEAANEIVNGPHNDWPKLRKALAAVRREI